MVGGEGLTFQGIVLASSNIICGDELGRTAPGFIRTWRCGVVSPHQYPPIALAEEFGPLDTVNPHIAARENHLA